MSCYLESKGPFTLGENGEKTGAYHGRGDTGVSDQKVAICRT